MRSRLVAVALSATVMVAVAFLVPLLYLVRDLAADRELSAAERDASVVARLVAVVGAEGVPGLVGPVLSENGEFSGRTVSIIMPDGVVIGSPLDPGEEFGAASAGRSFRQTVSSGEAVYVPVLVAGGDTLVVRAVADRSAIGEGVTAISVTLVTLATVLVALAVAVADRLGRSVVRPVDDLSAAADRLGAGDLDVRVEPSGPPEVRRVGSAFNRLASQIESLLQRERETAADLSHRLRTPLTAARLNADALAEGERKQRLISQLGEIERVVDHVIDEIRRPDRQAGALTTDVRQIVAERMAFWEPLAVDERRKLAFRSRGEVRPVAVPTSDLVAAVDALIGNVFAHTETGVDVTVTVDGSGHPPHVDVIVEDGGGGFPTHLDVMDRGSSGSDSTGLGLDIAARTAAASGGELMLGRSERGGAMATLRLGCASDD